MARRVAALYDIEGNLPALDAVLAEAEGEGVDVVVCGGDLVVGPSPAEVLDRLAELRDVRYLRGNADRMVLHGTDEYGTDWGAYRKRLGEARLAAVPRGPSRSSSSSTASGGRSSATRLRPRTTRSTRARHPTRTLPR